MATIHFHTLHTMLDELQRMAEDGADQNTLNTKKLEIYTSVIATLPNLSTNMTKLRMIELCKLALLAEAYTCHIEGAPLTRDSRDSKPSAGVEGQGPLGTKGPIRA